MGDKLEFIVLTIIVGVMGGIANWLMSDEHTIFQFIVSVFLAGFTGYLVGVLCNEYDISNNLTFFCCGVSGLSAKIILELCNKLLQRKASLVIKSIESDASLLMNDKEKKDDKK